MDGSGISSYRLQPPNPFLLVWGLLPQLSIWPPLNRVELLSSFGVACRCSDSQTEIQTYIWPHRYRNPILSDTAWLLPVAPENSACVSCLLGVSQSLTDQWAWLGRGCNSMIKQGCWVHPVSQGLVVNSAPSSCILPAGIGSLLCVFCLSGGSPGLICNSSWIGRTCRPKLHCNCRHCFLIPRMLLSTGASALQNAVVSDPRWVLSPGRFHSSISMKKLPSSSWAT